MSTSAARRGRRSCWLYGTRIADEHLWEDDGTTAPWEHGAGPLCMVCGLPRGTYDAETRATAP